MTNYQLEIPIYDCIVDVFFVESPVKKAIELNLVNTEKEIVEFDGYCADNEDNQSKFYLIFCKNPSINVIAHEVFHLTSKIISLIGSSLNEETEEPFAYLHGYILEMVYETSIKDNSN